MDSLTQGMLGASIGEIMLGKEMRNKAALIGAAVATIPDLDVLLFLFYDKFEMLSIHRGFSHSITFSLLGALLISSILNRTNWIQGIKYQKLFLFTWFCLFTHILLDSFTAYGTQLLSPFNDKRFGFDSINVVDPLYTTPLIIGLTLTILLSKLKKRESRFNKIGLIISSIYLLFTLCNKQMVTSDLSKEFNNHNIEYNSLLTMPVGIANINWYGIAKGRDSIFMLEHSILINDDNKIESFPINESLLNEIDDHIADKMRWFAKGFYTVEKENGSIRIYNLQVDMRGIIKNGGKKAPTAGYFEISSKNGKVEFTSGTIEK